MGFRFVAALGPLIGIASGAFLFLQWRNQAQGKWLVLVPVARGLFFGEVLAQALTHASYPLSLFLLLLLVILCLRMLHDIRRSEVEMKASVERLGEMIMKELRITIDVIPPRTDLSFVTNMPLLGVADIHLTAQDVWTMGRCTRCKRSLHLHPEGRLATAKLSYCLTALREGRK